MCGIVGYIGNENAVPYLLESLSRLEYRGYDSAGIAVLTEKGIETKKSTGRVSALKENIKKQPFKSSLGIGHTRWATHGEVSERNAHPHISYKGEFAVVHNGIIENYAALRDKLKDEGYAFVSDTDSEVVAHLLERDFSGDLISSLMKTVKKLEGAYALAVICKHLSDTLILIKNESPLVIGKGKNGFYIASDMNAISGVSDEYITMNDCEIALISHNKASFYSFDGTEILRSFDKNTVSDFSADKGHFPHFMLKEIFEQPDAIRQTFDFLMSENAEALSFLPSLLNNTKRTYIIGCGSAYHTAVAGKYVFEKLTNIPTEAVIASEFCTGNIPVTKSSLCIFVSQSGETADTLSSLKIAKEKEASVISIVNVPESSIARSSHKVIYTKAGPEIAVATTKAYTAQLITLYTIAVYASYHLNVISDGDFHYYINELSCLPQKIQGILHREKEIAEFATPLSKEECIRFIGRNTDYAAAMEGSLKMKEISYVPSEAYPAGELKHGTISLIEKGSLTIALCCNDSVFKKTANNIEEIRSRGGEIILITTEKHTEDVTVINRKIIIPDTDDLFVTLLEAIALQLLAYYTAKEKGCDIDKPRNLAKSVTVQ
jgi:glucosamine--fructose-6-phosphate aminotransferase (isomerizing)